MGRLTPNSTLKLYSNIFSSPTNNERPAWQSASAREAYFASHLVYEKTVQIVKKRANTVKVSLKDITGVQLEACNYLSFQNPHYDNKLYYARIMDKDFGNDGMAYVTFRIDWWLTDMFKLDVSQSSIEREHMSQADAVTASTNPYTGEILELRTAEKGLLVTEDLQKQVYNIGLSGDDLSEKDGLYMMQSLMGSASQDTMTYIMFISEIDYTAIAEEGVTPTPIDWMQACTEYVRTHGNGFTVNANEYNINSASQELSGKKWSNKLPHPYLVIGFDSTYETSSNQYSMKALIDKLTSWNCVSSILAIYGMPSAYIPFFAYSGYTTASAAPKELIYSGTGLSDLNGRSPKLACYPFSYLTITSPAGDVKEYQYERFNNIRNGTPTVHLYLIGDMAEKPRIGVIPKDYKETYSSSVQNPYGNYNEGLLFEQFATVAYVTDAWLAQIAAVSASAIANNTVMGRYQRQAEMAGTISSGISQMGDTIGGMSGGAVSEDGTLPNVGLGVSQGLDFAAAGGSMAQTMTSFEAQSYQTDIIKSAYSTITGDYEGAALYENMKLTRPAFVAHEYHKSNGDGTILMNTAVNADFCIIRRHLADVVADQYDEYFKKFGYASGRIGIPRVIYYVDGYTDASKLPDWQTTGDFKYTYIKTADAKIKCEDYEAEVEIAAMFNKGVRIIKGDELQ